MNNNKETQIYQAIAAVSRKVNDINRTLDMLLQMHADEINENSGSVLDIAELSDENSSAVEEVAELSDENSSSIEELAEIIDNLIERVEALEEKEN